MALKGRKPAMNTCVAGWRYQLFGSGTSRMALLVRHGCLYSFVSCRPTIAPNTVDGKCMNSKIANIKQMVVQGKAAVL